VLLGIGAQLTWAARGTELWATSVELFELDELDEVDDGEVKLLRH
jgi:hypothetical protein